MARLLAPLTRCVTRGWHMLFVGFLFGLSFETASEIGLLGLSASEMMNGLSPWFILAFPALFAAGMSLLDAADGAMMIGVYGWALSRPKRRLVYNIIITALSIFVALLVAGIGVAGLLAGRDDTAGGAFPAGLFDADMSRLGYVVVFVFAAAWLIAVVATRLRDSGVLDRGRQTQTPLSRQSNRSLSEPPNAAGFRFTRPETGSPLWR